MRSAMNATLLLFTLLSQSSLTPSDDLIERIHINAARRETVEARRSGSLGLRAGAAIAYGIGAAGMVWLLAEAYRTLHYGSWFRPVETTVPLQALMVGAGASFLLAGALHVAAVLLGRSADDEQRVLDLESGGLPRYRALGGE